MGKSYRHEPTRSYNRDQSYVKYKQYKNNRSHYDNDFVDYGDDDERDY